MVDVVIRHKGWRAARESGRRAKGTVYITPEADNSVSQSRGWPDWLLAGSAAASFGKTAVVFHLRLLCIIVATSIDCVRYVRYCELS